MEPLTYLVFFGIILFLGIIANIIAVKINFPPTALFLLLGMLAARLRYDGEAVFMLPQEFVVIMGLFALIIIVFYNSSNIKLREVSNTYVAATKLTLLLLLVNFAVVTAVLFKIFSMDFLLSMVISILLVGTSPDIVLLIFKDVKLKIIEIIKIESVINTPLVIIIPILIADFSAMIFSGFADSFLKISQLLLQQIMGGVGAGLVIGAILFKFLKKFYSSVLSPLMAIAGTIITYATASLINGNPLIAITVLGIMYGYFSIKAKTEITTFSKVFSKLLEILVFVIVGMMINLNIPLRQILIVVFVFLIITVLRFIVVYITLEGNLREKIFATLAPSKGIAIAVTALMLSTYAIKGIGEVINITLLVLLLTIITSAIVTKFSKSFIKSEITAKA